MSRAGSFCLWRTHLINMGNQETVFFKINSCICQWITELNNIWLDIVYSCKKNLFYLKLMHCILTVNTLRP